MAYFDDMKLSIESLSGGKNTVIFDDLDMPSIFVRIPKYNISEILTGGADEIHPAFIVDGVEKNLIYISKYQNIVMNNRAYSLPFKDPRVNVNFDQAKLYCENKGIGHHLMTNAEWAAIALWCRKNGFMPRGNNNYGKDHSAPLEKGVPTHMADATRVGRVATGSGPESWAHDNTNAGIFDLNGNVYEWVGGYRTADGEIQIIPDNNAAKHIDQSADSNLWRAILQNGSLVNPGTAASLKWDYTNPVPPGGTSSYPYRLVTSIVNSPDNESAYGATSFAALNAADGVSAPEILKALAIMPADNGDHGGDMSYMRNIGERVALRGGYWARTSYAGVFYVLLNAPRSHSNTNIGFRSAFVDL